MTEQKNLFFRLILLEYERPTRPIATLEVIEELLKLLEARIVHRRATVIARDFGPSLIAADTDRAVSVVLKSFAIAGLHCS